MQLMGSNSNMQQKSGTQPNWKDLADGIGIGMSVWGFRTYKIVLWKIVVVCLIMV